MDPSPPGDIMMLFRSIGCAASAAVVFGGCALFGSPSSEATPAAVEADMAVDTVFVVDTVDAGAEVVQELEARIGRLEIMLLERDARLAELQGNLDATRQEVVRNLAKLQSQASRAEAASGLAEAEIAVQRLERQPGGTGLSEYAEARVRIEESSTEFGQENFGGALYLATQARALASAAAERLLDRGGEVRPDETVFATPVPLRTVDRRANVRGGPGLEHDVLATLEPGTPLIGQSYTSEWVRIVRDDGSEGWIFHTLVTGRAR
jgi:hypothetical protein